MINFFKKVLKRLFPYFYNRIRIIWFVYHPNLSQQMYSCPWSLGEDIKRNCKIFLDNKMRDDIAYMSKLQRDIILCYYLYGTNTNEYFMHDMEHKCKKDRDKILSKKLKDDYCIMAMKGVDQFMQLKDKWRFYELAGKYFKREVMLVDSNTDRNALHEFLNRHSFLFAKPLEGTWGVGCFIIDKSITGKEIPTQLESGKWIVEERIEQDERMAVWNATSVNTLRIPSFRKEDGTIEIAFPLIRIGRQGCVVDNAGSGGVFASVDEVTGKICTNGYDERGNIYINHPDSHIKFYGYQIPCWEDLIDVVKEIHKNMPKEHKYIGFDMALSKKGWVLVEGNWGEFVMQQRALGKGIKEDFIKLLNVC